ncbi:MAG: Hybrid peroxiredoxin hyPrx5 [Sodalis sp.]|nr:MAG: Hybrid peroxiredoxin hyPrx5 [Sodalis sp.]
MMFIEPDKSGDPFKVSDTDTMPCHLAPRCQVQASMSLFKTRWPVLMVKQMLVERGMPCEEILLGKDTTSVSLRAVTGRATVP